LFEDTAAAKGHFPRDAVFSHVFFVILMVGEKVLFLR